MPTPILVQQGAVNRQTSGTNNTPSLTGVTAGNTLIATFWGGTSVSGPTDSSGQTWTLVGDTSDPSAGCSAIAYLFNANAGTHNLTWTNSGGASESNITEWSGLTAAGGTPVFGNNGGVSATTLTSPSYTPSQANELVIGVCGEGGNINPDNIKCNTAAFQSIGNTTDAGSHNCIMVNQDGNTYNASEANAAIISSAASLTINWSWDPSLVCSCTVAGFKFSSAVAQGAAPSTRSARLRLGTPFSRLKGVYDDSVIAPTPPTQTAAVIPRKLRLGTPLSRLKGVYDDTVTSQALTQITAAGVSATVGSANLGASGTLAATSISDTSSTANLGASGILSSTAISSTAEGANLNGIGQITAASVSDSVATANLAGTGVLAAISISDTVAVASLQGTGTVSASGISATSSVANLAPFSSGAITASGISATSGTADPTGSLGTLSATAISPTASVANLGATGSLTSVSVSATSASAQLGGLGLSNVAAVSTTSAAASASGIGSLSASGVSLSSATASLVPIGSLAQITAIGISATSSTADLEPTTPPSGPPPIIYFIANVGTLMTR